MSDQKWLTTSAGIKMPPIIYGTAWKKERTLDLVVLATQTGFRGIDTACQPKHYDEPGVGEAIVRLNAHGIKREALFVQTKFTPLSGQDPKNVPYDKNSLIELQVSQSFQSDQNGIPHLLLNRFGLSVTGPIVERTYGLIRFFMLYCATGYSTWAAFWLSPLRVGIIANTSA